MRVGIGSALSGSAKILDSVGVLLGFK